jgi:hypothetical protein
MVSASRCYHLGHALEVRTWQTRHSSSNREPLPTDSETKAHQPLLSDLKQSLAMNSKYFARAEYDASLVLTTKPRQSAARLPCSNTRREGSGPCRKSALFSARIKPKALYRRIYGEPPDGMTRPTWLLSKGLKGPDRQRPHPPQTVGTILAAPPVLSTIDHSIRATRPSNAE